MANYIIAIAFEDTCSKSTLPYLLRNETDMRLRSDEAMIGNKQVTKNNWLRITFSIVAKEYNRPPCFLYLFNATTQLTISAFVDLTFITYVVFLIVPSVKLASEL